MLSLESILLYFAKIRKKIKSTKEFGRFLCIQPFGKLRDRVPRGLLLQGEDEG